jgi:hypothetical protein
VEDQERAKISLDYALTVKNSFAEGGLNQAVKQLMDFINTLQ